MYGIYSNQYATCNNNLYYFQTTSRMCIMYANENKTIENALIILVNCNLKLIF